MTKTDTVSSQGKKVAFMLDSFALYFRFYLVTSPTEYTHTHKSQTEDILPPKTRPAFIVMIKCTLCEFFASEI